MSNEIIYTDDVINNNELEHFGTPRHSGRYPWGSGDNPYQHTEDFLSRIDELKKQGLNKTEIAYALGLSTTKFIVQESLAKKERKRDLIASVKSMKGDGYSNVQIAEKLGLKGESTVRSLLNADAEARMNMCEKLADNLKTIVDEKGMVLVGVGVERQVGGLLETPGLTGVSKEKMRQSLELLKMEGYEVWTGRIQQATNLGKYTTLKVLCPPGTPHSAIYKYDDIHTLDDYISRDGGDTLEASFVYPKSMDSNRIKINYNEEGGIQKDGVIELRRGVQDISLGNANYSQVRILVDDKYYMKGMAVYSDNIPDGVDVIYNTNKKLGSDPTEVFKKIKDDPENPFGSAIKEHGGQSYYIDANGEKQLSLINKRADEGDWGEWSKELSSQFLAKQPKKMIKKQLNLAAEDKQKEYDLIMSLTNPVVKKALLLDFAEDTDADSVNLKAAALPGTIYKVILPLTSLKDDEVYAPHLQDGTEVALIRFPHAGTFEIPILTVNNRNKEGKDVLTTNPSDAVGINSKVAERLSGADFDGDTVMVIPITSETKVQSRPPLKDLENFDTKLSYGPDETKTINGVDHYYRNGKEIKLIEEAYGYNQMGVISNLITDMTLIGASDSEKARAVRYSMVMIDTYKHHLDYKQCFEDNNIRELYNKYQTQYDENGHEHHGAATLISKAKSKQIVNERKEGAFFAKDSGNKLTLVDSENMIFLDELTNKYYTEKEKRTLYIDPITGEKLYHDTNRVYSTVKYKTKDGKSKTASVIVKDNNMYYKDDSGKYIMVTDEPVKTVKATSNSTKMAEASDARQLSSGTLQEELYAEYANKLKSLANSARKESLTIIPTPMSASAKIAYKDEVASLDYKLNQALLNAPKERYAQILAASVIKAKKLENPGMTNEEIRKLSQRELSNARIKAGAKRVEISITNNEWAAIQAGAISSTRLAEIVKKADKDVLKQLAMPRDITALSAQKIQRIKNMATAGYTTAEIAASLGYSVSTITKYLKGDV